MDPAGKSMKPAESGDCFGGTEHTKGAKTKKKDTLAGVFLFGGLEGDRTLDLTDANRTLSQLSYEPILEQGGNPAPMIIHIFK